MAGRSGRTYVRDSNGRFASTGGGGGGGGGKRAASGGKGKGKAAPTAGAAAPKRGKGKAAPAAAPAPAAPPASTKGRFNRVFTGKVTPAMKRAIEAPVRAAAKKVQKAWMSNGTYSGSVKTRSAKAALTRAKNVAAFAMETAKSQAARAKMTGSGPNRYASIRGTRVAGTISKRRPAAAPAPAAPAPAPKKGKGKAAAAAPAPAAPPASTKGRFTRVFTGAVSRLGQRKIAAPVRAAEQKLRQAQMNAGSHSGANKARAAKSALSRAKNKAAVAARAARVKSAVRGNSGIYGTKASGPKGVLSGTVAKPKGLKPGEVTARTSKPRPGIVNGVRIHQGFDPWRTFGLNGKTATKQDVERAYRKVARQTHPDAGGNRKDFERVKLMRDSLMAIWDSGKSSKRSGGKGKSKGGAAAAAPQGPRMLPPARTAAAPAPAAPKKTRSGGRGKGKSKAS